MGIFTMFKGQNHQLLTKPVGPALAGLFYVLIEFVEPGFPAGTFIPSMLEKNRTFQP